MTYVIAIGVNGDGEPRWYAADATVTAALRRLRAAGYRRSAHRPARGEVAYYEHEAAGLWARVLPALTALPPGEDGA